MEGKVGFEIKVTLDTPLCTKPLLVKPVDASSTGNAQYSTFDTKE
jgi:hypothetical protein